MPLISELPISQSTRPPTAGPTSPTPAPPSPPWQPARANAALPRRRQQNPPQQPYREAAKASLQRLERLAEDNWSKQTVPLPRNRIKKSTQNVRRILASERQFKHWHDEQVAQLVLGGNTIAGLPSVLASTGSRRTSAVQQMPMHPPPKPSTPRIKTEHSIPKSSPLATTAHTPDKEGETVDPLLITLGIPKMPSKRLMDALLAEGPLSWDAAAARPLENRMPGRRFCAVCGYWGKVRCKRCGERTCGLMECWKGHEGSCAVPAY